MRPEIPTLSPVRLPWILTVILAALLLSYCADNRVADGGSSSGVDNPSLTVGFVDASGTAVRVSGDLDIFAADQNPAVDPEPLVTVKVKNSAFTNLTGSDFERLLSQGATARASESLSKASAAIAAPSAVTLFNIMLRTKDRTGSLAMGFKYDSIAKAFSRSGAAATLKRFDLLPKPLVRYAAKVSREPVHGENGRMFVPGTPFLASLIDGVFVLEDMPEGLFPLRLLAGDGKVYAVPDSLNTLDSTLIYRPRPAPLGSIDTAGQDSVPLFSVDAGDPLQVFTGSITRLEGAILGVSPTDARLSVVWRHLKDSADTIRGDTLPRPPVTPPGPPKPEDPRKVELLKPTSLNAEVRFTVEGYYRFELRATLGVRSQADTVTISVTKKPPPAAHIVLPRPGDTVLAGRTYNVQWDMPKSGPVTLWVSVDSGRAWIELAKGYAASDSQPVYPWFPADSLGTSDLCLLKVRSESDSAIEAGMAGFFRLRK